MYPLMSETEQKKIESGQKKIGPGKRMRNWLVKETDQKYMDDPYILWISLLFTVCGSHKFKGLGWAPKGRWLMPTASNATEHEAMVWNNGGTRNEKPRNTFVYVHVNYSKNIIFKVIFVICKVLLYNPYNCCSDTLGFNDLFECARKKKQNKM